MYVRFFADAWKQPQLATDIRVDRYCAALEQLLVAIPHEFQLVIRLMTDRLESVLSLPLTLTHTDLSSGNMLIDPRTGHLTGIVDWADATIEPFGLALWGLQDILGTHGPNGYQYLFDAKPGRELFRDTFVREAAFEGDMEQLEWSRLLGVLLRYGFTWDCEANTRKPIGQDADVAFLKIALQGMSRGHSILVCDWLTFGSQYFLRFACCQWSMNGAGRSPPDSRGQLDPSFCKFWSKWLTRRTNFAARQKTATGTDVCRVHVDGRSQRLVKTPGCPRGRAGVQARKLGTVRESWAPQGRADATHSPGRTPSTAPSRAAPFPTPCPTCFSWSA